MSRSNTKRLGNFPNAKGTVTRLAYARAQAGGIDVQPLLKQADLTLQQIKDSDLRISVRDQVRFLNLTAAALQDDLLGFHLALVPDLRELGFLYYVSASSEVLDGALQRLARYSSITNEGVSLKYNVGKNVGIACHYVGISRHLDRHQMEFFVVLLICLCRQLTDSRLVPLRVRFTHRRDGDYSEFTEFVGSEIEFGASVDEVSFAPTVKDMPVVSADHHLNTLLIAYCEEALGRRTKNRGSLRSSVENEIVPLLPHGKARLDEIARRLGLSERTLARRLTLEELTFSGILENLKINLSKRYLTDGDLSISQVAWLLGYHEVSSFTHAFRRWTGKTPRQIRNAPEFA